jgi:hypothetical protein
MIPITCVTSFKKFRDQYDAIQRSFLNGMHRLGIPVIVPDNEVGIREACEGREGVTVLEGVRTGRDLGFTTGAVILTDLLKSALPLINSPLVMLANSDILLLKNFHTKLQEIVNIYGYDIFLTSSRYDIDLTEELNTEEAFALLEDIPRATFDPASSSDIFITSKFYFKQMLASMPAFIVGRYGWDNWIHSWVERNIPKKFNSTGSLITLHCKHDHRHIFLQEKAQERKAPSSRYNIGLWDKDRFTYGTVRINKWKVV